MSLSQTSLNGHNHELPHFILVPMMAQGHMIPMVDMARLLATRSATVSLITTPLNAARIKTIIDRIHQSGLPLRVLILRLPCVEAGLPEGCENVDTLPSIDLILNLCEAAAMLREPLIRLLREQTPTPTCIISDILHPWTLDVATELSLPRLTFNGFGCFSTLIRHIIYYGNILEGVVDDNEALVVPGLPHRIEITKAKARGMTMTGPRYEELRREMMRVEATADGVVVNSFDDLEPSYRELYEKIVGKKVWTIGPMFLSNKDVVDMAARGNKATIDEGRCLRWLDSMKPGSVLYVSFGSLARTRRDQVREIGLGLEASGWPFIWAMKAGDDREVEEWMAEGFEERVRERGLVIRGWAPQVMILSHETVGGFMSHCGWNSTLESVTAGVPMITWPHFAEQFLNERLVVEVLRIGVAVGVKKPTKFGVDDESVLVKREEVEMAVCKLMDGEEGKESREKAKELGGRARKAMEQGGSSYEHLGDLMKFSQVSVQVKEEKM